MQVGRAGRDGERATCTTLVSAADVPLLRAMVYGGTPSEAAVRGLLQAMFAGGDDEADFNFYDLSQVSGWGCGLNIYICPGEMTMIRRERARERKQGKRGPVGIVLRMMTTTTTHFRNNPPCLSTCFLFTAHQDDVPTSKVYRNTWSGIRTRRE